MKTRKQLDQEIASALERRKSPARADEGRYWPDVRLGCIRNIADLAETLNRRGSNPLLEGVLDEQVRLYLTHFSNADARLTSAAREWVDGELRHLVAQRLARAAEQVVARLS